jgi:hypothetical protein
MDLDRTLLAGLEVVGAPEPGGFSGGRDGPGRAMVSAGRGLRAAVRVVSLLALATAGAASAQSPSKGSGEGSAAETPGTAPIEIVVHVTDLPRRALDEFEFWSDPASPGGRLVGTPNTGDELDPPPEDDPHVRFRVRVQRAVPYRCWIHMKVGKPKGKSQANLLYVQVTNAVDREGREVFKPGTGSYLAAQGPMREGWTWVGCDPVKPASPDPYIRFRTSGDVNVRIQAGMEGVGFDQFLLSPARFLDGPPSGAVVPKPVK